MLIDDRMRDLSRLLDVTELRGKVHAANLANQNTPGFRAREVRFEDAFRQAFDSQGAAAARAVEPEVAIAGKTAIDNDGNDVSVDAEVGALARNSLLHQTYITTLRGKFALLQAALRGAEG